MNRGFEAGSRGGERFPETENCAYSERGESENTGAKAISPRLERRNLATATNGVVFRSARIEEAQHLPVCAVSTEPAPPVEPEEQHGTPCSIVMGQRDITTGNPTLNKEKVIRKSVVNNILILGFRVRLRFTYSRTICATSKYIKRRRFASWRAGSSNYGKNQAFVSQKCARYPFERMRWERSLRPKGAHEYSGSPCLTPIRSP